MANADRLSDVYWDLQSEEEPVGLEAFVQRVVAGEYGPVTRDELCTFLRAVEQRLVARIERGEGTVHAATARDELVDETRSWIDDLVGKFCES